jgi:uncharacterized protein YggE
VSITALFTDFDALTKWVAFSSGVEGLSIGYINWALTDAKRLAVERRTRQKAVRDAKRRAQDYADALDLGAVRVRSISDPGLGQGTQHKVFLARSMAAPDAEPAMLELRPEEITISAEVEATFTVPIRH